MGRSVLTIVIVSFEQIRRLNLAVQKVFRGWSHRKVSTGFDDRVSIPDTAQKVI